MNATIPWLKTKEVNFCRIYETENQVSEAALNETSVKLIPKNSVIVAMYGQGDTAGRVAINKIPLTANQACCNLVIDEEKADYQFVYFYLKQSYNELVRRKTGSAQPNLNTSIVKAFEILLPPIEEQKAIANILGSLDDKIELNRQMNVTLEAIAQALFKSWFVDLDPVIDNAIAANNPISETFQARAAARQALGDKRKPLPPDIQKQFGDRFVFNDDLGWIPGEWEISSFGKVSTCFDSKRIPLSKKEREEKQPGIIPYYGATSVVDYINEWIFDDVFLLVGEDGSVIKDDGTPFIQYIWRKAWVNNHAHVLQGAAGVSTEHLLLFISSQNVSAYVTGAVQPKINQKNLNSILFLNAGENLNKDFASLISPYFNQKRVLLEHNETLEKLRDTLLPKLLSGQIRIPDAEALVAEVI